MKKLINKRIIALLFFAGILINQAVAEENGMDEMMDNMKEELDLSDKQADQVQVER